MTKEERIWLVAKIIDPEATAVLEKGEPAVNLKGDPKTESVRAADWIEWSLFDSKVRTSILPAAERIIDALNRQ